MPTLDFSHLLYILLASAITNNIALTYFLGMCPFLSISKNLSAALGMGLVVTTVIVPTAATNWLLNHYLLEPWHLEIFQFMVFIITIAGMVQIVGVVIQAFEFFEAHQLLGTHVAHDTFALPTRPAVPPKGRYS